MANRSTVRYGSSGSAKMLEPFYPVLACCGNNCGPQPGCHIGPVAYLEDSAYSDSLRRSYAAVHEAWCRSREDDHLEATGDFCDSLAKVIGTYGEGHSQMHLQSKIPLVIGGDHSCAIGTWRGVSQRNQFKKIGLIWCDAHLDSHTPESSHSGAIHGMPFAALAGEGHPSLAPFQVVDPAYCTFIGTRSYEPEEVEFLKRHGVTIVYMPELLNSNGKHCERSYGRVFKEAVQRAAQAPGGIGITIDLDGFDPEDAQQISCPEPGGMNFHALCRNLFATKTWEGIDLRQLKGLEIAEFNPAVEGRGTVRIMDSIVSSALALFKSRSNNQ